MIKVGSILVENGVVHRVHKVVVEKNGSTEEKIIHYKPFYRTASNDTVVCSIPESSLKESNIRLISTKDEIKDLYKLLSDSETNGNGLDFDNALKLLTSNDIKQTVKAIKYLWNENNVKPTSPTKTATDLVEKSINLLTEEVSYISGNSTEIIKKKIKLHLTKYSPQPARA